MPRRAGERLPTTRALAAHWGADPGTVHHALRVLVREGWLTRRPRAGTFVRDRAAKLTQVAVYYPEHRWEDSQTLFLHSLHGALKSVCNTQGATTEAWVDPRPAAAAERWPWPDLVTALERGEFQALIVPYTDPVSLRWLAALPVPSVFVTSANLPNVVGFDLAQFADLAFSALARQGCRSVGLISAVSTGTPGAAGVRERGTEFYERVLAICQACGLTLRNEWMRLPPKPGLEPAEHGPFGYDQFHALWRQRTRPDGLVVYPDSMAVGAILAAAQLNVRVPRDLRLVFHRNAGVPLLCPLPATFVVSDERMLAEAIWRQLRDQFDGQQVSPRLVSFTLQPSNSKEL